MRILQLSPHDHKGGASRIAWYLFRGYKNRDLESYLAVGKKSLIDPNIYQINHDQHLALSLYRKIRKHFDINIGLENFNYPATLTIPQLPPAHPDIIHGHNLQGNYFDLRVLPKISAQFPTIMTLHDTWMLTGHCAYFIDCDRWQRGCGKCPHLNFPPRLRRDASAFNWKRKQKIYSKSRVFIATPSKWLLDQVTQSILSQAVINSRVIHNGVDTSVFTPANKAEIRRQLGIDKNAFVLLYVVANMMKKNLYKDYQTIEKTLNYVGDRVSSKQKLIFLGLGERGETQYHNNLEKRFVPYQLDIRDIAKYYQAADVYIHAARADNFPNVILEALACGTPVVATIVGGIVEQIVDGKTGNLVPPAGFEQMGHRIISLINDPNRKHGMAILAAKDAKNRFSLDRMLDEYLDFYDEILATWSVRNNENNKEAG